MDTAVTVALISTGGAIIVALIAAIIPILLKTDKGHRRAPASGGGAVARPDTPLTALPRHSPSPLPPPNSPGREAAGSLWQLLEERGLLRSARVKVVRHKDNRYDLGRLEREGWIELYQSYQADRIFECDYIVSFIGQDARRARFFGVYKVTLPATPANEHSLPANFPHPEFAGSGYHYTLTVDPRFADLGGVVIDWGEGARMWHQWLRADKDKPVIQGLPGGDYDHGVS
ncbi:MAG TPA: hypothetical protein VFW33_09990 [Gemmataceae bacterium]|nr:hypothetical protein [Gemmataceae bacterium]